MSGGEVLEVGKSEIKPALSAREKALKALVRVERDGAYLNLVLPPLLDMLPPRDRALAVKLSTGTIQRLNTLDWALGLYLKKPLGTLTPWIRNLLRLSAYQLIYLEKIPPHAAVDEGVRLARRYGHRGVAGLVNAVLRRVARSRGDLPWPSREKETLNYLSLYYSYPEWLVKNWLDRFGEEMGEAALKAGNEEPPLSLRPNTMRTTAQALQVRLEEEGVEAEPSPLLPGAIRVTLNRSPVGLKAFREGLFTIQGESSMLVAPILEPRPGEKVLDLCSAPGGKTTHLAELTADRGSIIAADIHNKRLELVKTAARRLGLTGIEVLLMDGRKAGQAGLPFQDRVLVDAPCSGLGVVRRLPELKWRRLPEDIFTMQKRQLALLDGAADLVKPGGTLLYSVCSTEPGETVEVVKAFNQNHPAFTMQPVFEKTPASFIGITSPDCFSLELQPHLNDLDGFFITLWQRRLS